MSKPVLKKEAVAALDCPKCKVAPEVRRKGRYWLYVCPKYVDMFSACKHVGHEMATKRDAVEQWNINVSKSISRAAGASA